MRNNTEKYSFIQKNSPDGGFLQSEQWLKFQESFGRKTFNVSDDNFWANIVEHELPIVGKYFYIPRGPVACHPERSPAFGGVNSAEPKELTGVDSSAMLGMTKIIELAKKENIGWIRFDANNDEILNFFRENFHAMKAPHNMQPRELFVIDIAKSKEQLLAEMKSKTRYNIKLAEKRSVKKIRCEKQEAACDRAIDEFVRLIKITAQRDKITPHPDEYYRKMFETIPEENLKLYLAEFEGKIIAANIVVFYGKVATYLHGASDSDYRNVMAPYLLQWQVILDAKEMGCEKYDFGGIKKGSSGTWAGITRFKTGFSSTTEPTKFPGSYDIVTNPFKYNLYRILQRIKSLF